MGTKIVCFDWDNTLAKTPMRYSWSLIDKELGCLPEMKALEERYNRKEFDFLEWCKLSVETYKKFGLTEKKFRKMVKEQVTLHAGAVETIDELRSRKIVVGIISGGIKNVYDVISESSGLKVDYTNFAATFIFDRKTGKLTGADYDVYESEGKLHMLKAFCNKANATLEEAVFVGDSDNDIEAFEACTGIAFDSDSDNLKKHAKFIIKDGDLSNVLRYIV